MMMEQLRVESGIDSSMTANKNAETSSVSHEVTVKVLGLKSIVSNLKPNIRVVVATLNNGEVSAKTALSSEFGNLHDEESMSMAIWEDKGTTDSTLFFDSELNLSSTGTFAQQNTDGNTLCNKRLELPLVKSINSGRGEEKPQEPCQCYKNVLNQPLWCVLESATSR